MIAMLEDRIMANEAATKFYEHKVRKGLEWADSFARGGTNAGTLVQSLHPGSCPGSSKCKELLRIKIRRSFSYIDCV